MNKATLIKQVKDLVRRGQTGEAINALLNFLERHQRQRPELYEEVIQLKAIFKRAKRQAAMNIISEDDATKELQELNDTIYDIVYKINKVFKEKGKRETSDEPSKTLFYGLTAVLVGVIAMIIFSFWRSPQTAIPGYCPEFGENSSWQMLVVPYQYSTNTNIEIKSKLDSVSYSVGFNTDCQIADINFNDELYPNTLRKAKVIGSSCQTDLIFWKNISEDIKKTRYHFVNIGDYFQFNLLSPGKGNFIDSIVVETSIPSSSEISDAEGNFMYTLLLGVSANKVGKHPIAVRLLNSIPDSLELSTDFSLLKQLHLADSYRMLENKEAAIEAYNTILNNYDGYTLASMNRGVLQWALGNYKAAIQDFNTVLQADSSHVVALYARGRTCAKMRMIDQAENALQQAEQLIGANSSPGLAKYKEDIIDKTLVEVKRRKSEIREEIRLGKDAIRRKSEDPKLFNELARAYLQVGETHHAIGLLYKLGPGELENTTKQIIRNRIIAQADENFLADLEALVMD